MSVNPGEMGGVGLIEAILVNVGKFAISETIYVFL
jgi:hypothetical protein